MKRIFPAPNYHRITEMVNEKVFGAPLQISAAPFCHSRESGNPFGFS
jgi:hypothetical protein